MKELTEIQAKGTPEGITLISAEDMLLWKFTLSVLGEETIYRVRHSYRLLSVPLSIPPAAAARPGRFVMTELAKINGQGAYDRERLSPFK